jgi:hypothetical protein
LQTTQTYTVRLGAEAQGNNSANSSLFMRNYLYTNPGTGEASCNQSANNGNIMQIVDLLNGNNTQSFCYDSLNRLNSFSTAGGSMNQYYSIDAWGNVNLESTPGPGLPFTQSNQPNPANGYIQDAAGNVTGIPNPMGGTIPITYAESKLINYQNGAAAYTYNADGSRVRKDTSGTWTEYVYFDGQPLAEKNADGTWSDYIYANGQRIARADTYDIRIHLSGTNCSNCGSNPNMFAGVTSLTAANNQPINTGDVLTWRQAQCGSALGGIILDLQDSSNNYVTGSGVSDTDGQPIDAESGAPSIDAVSLRFLHRVNVATL